MNGFDTIIVYMGHSGRVRCCLKQYDMAEAARRSTGEMTAKRKRVLGITRLTIVCTCPVPKSINGGFECTLTCVPRQHTSRHVNSVKAILNQGWPVQRIRICPRSHRRRHSDPHFRVGCVFYLYIYVLAVGPDHTSVKALLCVKEHRQP